jgi:DNA (cytosine-5)-methyltransferase 1
MRALDFFCGAGGMTHGLMRSGVEVLGGIDNDISCKETYEFNNAPAKFLDRNIRDLSCDTVSFEFQIERNQDDLVFVGCSPCQYWSKINTDKTKSATSAFLLAEFQRFVAWFNPGFVVIENVPGLLTKTAQSILPGFLKFLGDHHYVYDHDVVNANHFGVPQHRMRYLLFATRVLKEISLPKGRKNKNLIVKKFLGLENGFSPIPAGHYDATRRMHAAAKLSPANTQRMIVTAPDGGTREAWRGNPDLQIEAYEGKDHIFRDVYARMYWNKPSPTITTRFNSFSNGRFGHPEEHRAISLREGATLQTFPKSYFFKCKNQAAIARQIGNAVPPALAERIGRHLVKIFKHA